MIILTCYLGKSLAAEIFGTQTLLVDPFWFKVGVMLTPLIKVPVALNIIDQENLQGKVSHPDEKVVEISS